MYRVLDLFSGAAGGWSLGLHRAGFVTVAACEADPWRREQYAKNFPGVRLYDDVRTLTAERLRADGALPDIIVGSPPCQDASSANAKGKGIDGERTGLFLEWLRLVREVRPRWACAENVPGIRTRGIDRVLDGLAAASYAFWPLVVGAADFGANHLRRRLVLVAADAAQIAAAHDAPRLLASGGERAPRAMPLRDGAHPNQEGQHARAGDAGEMAWRAGDARHAADAHQVRCKGLARPQWREGTEAQSGPVHHWCATAPDFSRVDDGIPGAVARACISAYGDAFLPQKAEAVGRAILAADHAAAERARG